MPCSAALVRRKPHFLGLCCASKRSLPEPLAEQHASLHVPWTWWQVCVYCCGTALSTLLSFGTARSALLTLHLRSCFAHAAGPLLDALGEAYDAPAEGTGFFALQSCANHDCAPSAHAVKPPGAADGAAVISAARRIRAGEEITLCYVEADAPLAERQEALRDYGFVCACERCRQEAAAGASGLS